MSSSFTFLHAADLHLGSPLLGLALKDEEIAARFAQAGREALRRLVDAAIEAKCAFAVIAGDIYDGEWTDVSTGLHFNREMARLDRAGIPAFTLRGNHDAMSEVTRGLPLPATLKEFGAQAPETFRLDHLKVALHGQSYARRDIAENLAFAYPAPVAGWLNIGVLHTALTGRAGHELYAPCTVGELALRGYDYWALGHVHEHEIVSEDPWIVYPGNLQGRSVRECGEKGAVLVDVVDGRVAGVRRLIVDNARWAVAEVGLQDIADEQAAIAAMRQALKDFGATSGGLLTAMRLRLSGATALHRHLIANRSRLAEDIQAVAAHVHADLWIEKLEIATAEPGRTAGAEDALAGLDIAAALDEAAEDAELLAGLRVLALQVKAKLPGTMDLTELDDDAALLAEAKALVLGRLQPSARA